MGLSFSSAYRLRALIWSVFGHDTFSLRSSMTKKQQLLLIDDYPSGGSVAGRSGIGRIVVYGGGHRLESPHQDVCLPALRRVWEGRDVLFAFPTRSISVLRTMIPRDSCSFAKACADHTD